MDIFNGEKFNIWKFIMKMVLVSMDLWKIMDEFEETLPSNVDFKVKKEYQRRIKKAVSIIGLNLADNQFAHIKSCTRLGEAWKTLCNILEMKSLSNIIFVRRKFFTCKMQEDDGLLEHFNKVKALVDQFACLEVPVRNNDIVMTLFESLPALYEYLITILKTMPMNESTMEYVTTCLIHKMLKMNDNESQGDDVVMLLC